MYVENFDELKIIVVGVRQGNQFSCRRRVRIVVDLANDQPTFSDRNDKVCGAERAPGIAGKCSGLYLCAFRSCDLSRVQRTRWRTV